MSAPFGGGAPLPFNTANEPREAGGAGSPNADEELAKLSPPRKHYQTYYTTREANENMWHPPQGVHNFLRAYYHMKSADWAANKPFALASNAASEQAKLPRYYVMDLNKGMAEQVASEMPTRRADRELQVAHRRRAEGLQLRVRPQRIPGRPAVVSRRPRAAPVRGAAALRRPHDRRAVALPVGQERLGRVSTRRQPRRDAARVHEVRRRGARRRRRPLGAAGTRRARRPIGWSNS